MKAIIIYDSKTGTTEKYAQAIGEFLHEKGIENKVFSIANYDESYFNAVDVVILGAWTKGLFFFAQHPDVKWKIFASNLPEIKDKEVVLFTTYKLLTGSMFKKMKSTIINKIDGCQTSIKSKNGELTPFNKEQLEGWISSTTN